MADIPDDLPGFGRFRIDLQKRTVYRDGVIFYLRTQELKVLLVLFQKKNEVVGIEELRKLAWGENTHVVPHTVQVTVRGVRNALGEIPDEWIKTVPRRGYMLAVNDEIPVQNDSVGSAIEARRRATKHFLASLHQIPRSPRSLPGRSETVAELVRLIEANSEDIIGLYGMGGVGKTALAFKIIESLHAQHHFNFYVDLGGLSETPMSPARVMASVIRAHYPGTSLPQRADELAGLYRSVLNDRHAVLLFDNASDARQMAPLLPPAGNLLIVTSRLHITLPGMCPHEVACLLPDDAEAMLLERESRIGIHAKQIAKLCGYLPLALQAAGSVISETVDLDPAEYVRQLSNLQDRLALKAPGTDLSVESSLALSYQFLGTKELKRCFRVLAVFPSSFDRSAAASILHLEPYSAREVLSVLLKHSVIGYDRNSSRYRLHDLVRLFATTRLSKTEEAGARTDHSRHFLNILAEADQLYEKGHENTQRGLRLAEMEWDNIAAGWEWAKLRSNTDDTAANLANSYPTVGWNYLHVRQHPEDRIVWRTTALTAALHLQDRRSEGIHLGNLGLARKDLGEMEVAIEYFDKALVIAREVGDVRHEGMWIGNLGIAYSRLGHTQRAIDQCYKEALAIARKTKDRWMEAIWLGNLGIAYRDLGDLNIAVKHLREELEIASAIGHVRGECMALIVLGVALRELGDLNAATEHHETALRKAREIGDRREEGYALGELGMAAEMKGNNELALEQYKKILVIFRETGDVRNEGETHFAMAVVLEKLGRRSDAIAAARSARGCWEPINDPRALKATRLLHEWGRTVKSISTDKKEISRLT
jgi:DNA-binding winged helix-turn-helix (wHTH) protein/tetratricopeptide (TPR) repeat protein